MRHGPTSLRPGPSAGLNMEFGRILFGGRWRTRTGDPAGSGWRGRIKQEQWLGEQAAADLRDRRTGARRFSDRSILVILRFDRRLDWTVKVWSLGKASRAAVASLNAASSE